MLIELTVEGGFYQGIKGKAFISHNAVLLGTFITAQFGEFSSVICREACGSRRERIDSSPFKSKEEVEEEQEEEGAGYEIIHHLSLSLAHTKKIQYGHSLLGETVRKQIQGLHRHTRTHTRTHPRPHLKSGLRKNNKFIQ